MTSLQRLIHAERPSTPGNSAVPFVTRPTLPALRSVGQSTARGRYIHELYHGSFFASDQQIFRGFKRGLQGRDATNTRRDCCLEARLDVRGVRLTPFEG